MPYPPPWDLPNPGIEPRSPTLQVDSLLTKPPGKPKNMEWDPTPSPGDLPDPGIKLESPALEVDSSPVELQESLVVKVQFSSVQSLSRV